MKPHIRRYGKEWLCFTTLVVGHGPTPQHAYDDFQLGLIRRRREAYFMHNTIPRRR